jgi:iron-sulfur cluster repair protein YtfE (RIC family)
MGRVLEDHRRLRQALSEIESTLAAPPAPATLATLTALLAALRARLRSHFKAEEQGGLFRRIQEAAPEQSAACARLLGQHAAILTRLDRLQAEATAYLPGQSALDGLRAAVRELLNDLARHEERENELLLRTLEGTPAAD